MISFEMHLNKPSIRPQLLGYNPWDMSVHCTGVQCTAAGLDDGKQGFCI